MEKDDEAKGSGNHLDFGARCYDSRLGRWLSLEPLASKFPELSPYVFAYNSPISFVDPDGMDPREGNKQLTINFGRCYITIIVNPEPSFKYPDPRLERRARNFLNTGIGLSFSPLIRAPKILSEIYGVLENIDVAMDVIEQINSASANEHLRAWQVAAKSEGGYSYIEIDLDNKRLTERRVINAGKHLDVEGYENFVAQKTVEEDGKIVEQTFYTLVERENDEGNKELQIRTQTINYAYGKDGSRTSIYNPVTYEKAIPDLKGGEWDETQPGDLKGDGN